MTNENAINVLRYLSPPRTSKTAFDAFRQAIDMAIEALSQPEPHWIPVTERLPEVGREILFCDIDGDIFVGHRATEHWWSVDDKVKNVIAWCELPEPWKGE